MTEIILLGLAGAVAWKLFQLSKAPRDAPLRSVTLCLLSAALSYPLAMPGGASGVDTVAGHGTAKLVQNLLLLATVYFLMCFYLYSAEGQSGRRRARREAVLVVLVAVSISAAALTVPHEVFAGSFSTADMTVPQLAFFYGGAGLYLTYALTVTARWTYRYARMSRRPHSTGLWMAAAGLGMMAAACAIRAVFVAVRWSGGTVTHPLMAGVAMLLVVSILLFVAGVTYSGVRVRVASIRLWLRHRRDHRRLEPLWQVLTDAYPQNVLGAASPALRDRWRARKVHRRYHRRIVECRDGLVDISPYLADGDDEVDGPALGRDPAELAVRLRRAAAQIGDGVRVPRQAVPLAMDLGDDREADVRQLIAVSDALRRAA
ncbi:MAB_1171c family putative transporter [Streptomyces exfoliatus]|uniref:MAB_1171c family putative transporter n=1 Tax=Streptomyces exfoliatus TaxID=1905 RepID=UPI0004B0435E|nr:MAB_1171c family putative transporter [Streptomyces exfoliatus]